MTGLLSWPVLAAFGAGIGTLGLVRYLLFYWEKPGARWFVLALTGQAVFCLAYAVGFLTFDPTAREWIEVVAIVALHWLGVPFLAFALEYTGRGELVKGWTFRSLFAIPIAVTVLLPLNGWHGLFWDEFTVDTLFGAATATYSFQPLFYLTVFGGIAVAGIGALLLFETVWSYGPLYRGEALAVGLSPVPPTLGLFAWLFEVGIAAQLNVLVFLLIPHIFLDAYAFVGKGMFEFHPATSRAAEQSVLDDLQSPVLVLDERGRIVSYNSAARAFFDLSDDVLTMAVSTVLGQEIDLDGDSQQLTFQTEHGNREFRVESSPLTDSGTNHVGYTLLFQDITEAVEREERLSVLNRVLRHNLRNELTVIRGNVKLATEEATDDRIEEALSSASNSVDSLLSVSETARSVERTLGSASTETVETELETVLADLSDAGEGRITVTAPEARIRTNPDVLRAILGQLVDNAIEHNDSQTPEITVSAAVDGSTLSISVVDNGPGIPAHELEALQSGNETSLQHGSGLGLWLSKWGTERLGGEIAFESTDDGTTVTLVIPGTVLSSEQKREAETAPVSTTD